MTTTAEDESEPERSTRRRRRRPKLSVGQSIGVAGGFVSLVGGVVTLLFLFVPGCQPKAPVDEGSAEITNVRIERGITFGQYLVRSSLPRGSMSSAFLDRHGVLVRFHYVVHGFRG